MPEGVKKLGPGHNGSGCGRFRGLLFKSFWSAPVERRRGLSWMHRFSAEPEKNLLNNSPSGVVKLLLGSWVENMLVADNSPETVRLRLKLIGSCPEVYG
tara:strand:+ start:58 stop:354 length:297 start_codon:yes stop_codon:yes gene_type:complete